MTANLIRIFWGTENFLNSFSHLLNDYYYFGTFYTNKNQFTKQS